MSERLTIDDEPIAIAELGRRASRLRTQVNVACAIAGVLGGAAGAFAVIALALALLGEAEIGLCVALGFGLPFLASLLLARKLGRLLVRRRAGEWLDELAARHRVDRAKLAPMAELWS